METIKIIDLLVKYANGEELPKKIKYDTHLWEYDNDLYDYYCKEEDIYLSQWFDDVSTLLESLNDEVEIIEEGKKIEKIPLPTLEEFKKMSAEERYLVTAKEYDLLDELIDKVNKLESEMNK